MDEERFRNPEASYRPLPFWFWNGDMNDEEIQRQIMEMAEKGVGGFFICPRQGLQIPYLSETWFAKVGIAIAAAKKHGLEVWLYDEYPYPSGIAGGEVTLLHPEAKHQTVTVTHVQADGGEKVLLELPWAKVLLAKAVPVSVSGERQWREALDIAGAIGNIQTEPIFQKTGLTAYNQKRFFTYGTKLALDWQPPRGMAESWDVIIYQEKEIEDFKYYGTFVDPCNREAMATFIKLTHERYARHFQEEFGATVKGMFTDEIGLLGDIPWSPRLEAFFLQRNGYSITEHLPALSDEGYPDAPRIRYDYYQAVHELLTGSYHKQVFDWCEKHGLSYVAEVPAIRMTTQRFSHIPGGDSAHEKLGRSLEWVLRRYAASLRDNPKMASSIARQLGRKRCLDECFHSVGWSMNLQDAKWMIDRMAAMGTNMYAFHAFFYTVDGLTQHDAPPSQFYQNPYWPHFRQLADYTARLSWVMATGTADIRIALLDPTTTLWTHRSNPLHHFHYAGTSAAEKERMERLKEEWTQLSVHLLQSRRDFDHMDPEILAEAAVDNGRLTIGHAAYSVLLLPPITNLEARAWETLKRFIQAGGTVISLGELPSERIEPESRVPEEAAACFQTMADAGELGSGGPALPSACFLPRRETGEIALDLLDALLDRLLPRAAALNYGGDNASFLLQGRYMPEGDYLVFAANQEDRAWACSVQINPEQVWPDYSESRRVAARLLDLETGGSRPVEVEWSDKQLIVPVPAVAPYTSFLLQLSRDEPAAVREHESGSSAAAWSLPIEAAAGPWRQTARQPNALRLEHFCLTLGHSPGEAATVSAKTLIDQCEDLAREQRLPVAFSQIFGTPKKLKLSYPITCSYKARFYAQRLPEECSLLMDRSAIKGGWTLKLNGTAYNNGDFRGNMIYDSSNIICDVRSGLQEGWNELEVEVTANHDWDGVTDALYLYGDFGIRFDPAGFPVLAAPPASTASLATDTYYDGYPYYAGTMSFSRSIHLDRLPHTKRFAVHFPDWMPKDLAEVLLNGESLGIRPWSPYIWEGDSGVLRQGDNLLEVRLTGTLIGLLEGKYFDYRKHRVEPVHIS